MAILIRIFLIVLFVVILVINRRSCKNGIILFWASLFIVPSVLLNVHIISFINVYNLQILIISIFFFLNKSNRKDIILFCRSYNIPILVLLGVYLTIILFSEKVPLKSQIYSLLKEILEILIIIETLIVAKKNHLLIRQIYFILPILILCNVVYSIIYEIGLRTNPAGLPLYILLGKENNEYLADMIDVSRGIMDFRLQSIFGHPLSLGQYFLLIVPMFLCKTKYLDERIKWLSVVFLCVMIFLSGTRGALFPLIFIFGLYLIKQKVQFVYKMFFMLPFLIVLYSLIPLQLQRNIDKYVDSFTTYIQFWNDKKQSKSEIGGSSMSMRFEQFAAANDEIKNNPLFGEGREYREYYQEKYNQQHPKLLGYESFVLLQLVEQGWIGLCVFIVLILYMYYIFKKSHCNIWILKLLFIAFFLSTLMTGIRQFSFLILGMSAIVITTSQNRKTLI